MTLDWIKTETADAPPAGPDLWETDDAAFSEYYFDAAARLPEAEDYAKLGLEMGDGGKVPDVIFDPKSVSLDSELTQIDALLQRSRDLRLLTLRSQWCMLAGEIDAAATSLIAMADLLEEMPDAAHPIIDGSPRDRLEAINDLTAMGAMILPLRYLDIGGSGASRRRMMVAHGDVTPHDGEEDINIDEMVSSLVNAREKVAKDHEALVALRSAIARIENACLANDTPHTPQLNSLSNEIEAVLSVIALADPSLSESASDDETDTAPATSPPQGEVVISQRISTEVKDHDEARSRLTAVETYFGKFEPSSAAVLLVTQSRLLIGKSLVDAIDILMPETAPRAKVDFIADSGFQLAHGQLRALADDVLIDDTNVPPSDTSPSPEPTPMPQAFEDGEESDTEEAETSAGDDPVTEQVNPEPPRPEPPVAPALETQSFHVADAAQATAQIQAVETYFRTVEKSSPIPMLLARARSYVGKDFEALLKELVPKLDL